MATTEEQAAFILRIAPSGNDKVLQANQIIIGWAHAEGLLNPKLDWGDFRGILDKTYYSEESTRRKAGAAAGNMWRFIRDMKPGNLRLRLTRFSDEIGAD